MKPLFSANITAYSDAWRGRGVNFSELAQRCNVSKSQFSEYRNGKRHNPGVWTALNLAEGLGVTIDALVTDRPSVREDFCRRIFEGRPVL